MCMACNWMRFRGLLDLDETTLSEESLSRRQVLQASAVFAAASIAPALGTTPADARPAGAKADLVFRNGAVYTVNGGREWARAVAVRQKHIVYVGDDAGVRSFIGPRTRVVDLAGKMLLPGFVEGHIHPVAALPSPEALIFSSTRRDETLEVLKAYRAKLGKVDVIRGFGWRYNAFPATGPRKEDLDQIWPDTPVILAAIDGHSAWVNSKALAVAKVTKATKDPLPGFSYFQRDPASGEPTGYLVEPPAMLQGPQRRRALHDQLHRRVA